MKRVDTIATQYISKNEVFADIFNYYLYDGKETIKKEELEDINPNELYTNGIKKERIRDVFKKAVIKRGGKSSYLLLGIENQTKSDYEMVLRCIEYDLLAYMNQLEKVRKNKKDGLSPVITLVIYFGARKWNGPRSLHEMINMSDTEKKYCLDYKLNLIEPYNMTENDFNKLKSDFGLIMNCIKFSKDKEKFKSVLTKEDKMSKMGVELLNEITNFGININEESEGEAIMCKAVEDWKRELLEEGKAEGRAEGRAEGKAEGLTEGEAKGRAEGALDQQKSSIKTMNKNGFEPEVIAKALSLDIDFVKEVLAN